MCGRSFQIHTWRRYKGMNRFAMTQEELAAQTENSFLLSLCLSPIHVNNFCSVSFLWVLIVLTFVRHDFSMQIIARSHYFG